MSAPLHLGGMIGDHTMDPGGGADAKLLTLVVPPGLFDQIKQALAAFGVRRMVVTQVYRVDDRDNRVESYRGQRFETDVSSGLRVELLVRTEDVTDLVRMIGRIGTNHQSSNIQIWMTDARRL
ncbi:P-II family nitrogen regulator [Nocardia concava]|uniref:P-II family nitrogen regulator n=1 Tax=Nocardia concava TaxID=257281 RepID=UPI0002EB82A1|nr:P-II family nitrogen regulator [Nocardia concava]